MRAAMPYVVVLIGLALSFAMGILFIRPTEAALLFAPFRCLRQLDPFFSDPQPRLLI